MNLKKLLKLDTLDGRVLLNAPKIETFIADSGKDNVLDEVTLAGPDDPAHLVASYLPNGKHKPTLDLDFPCRLEESTTPGHYHLFIDIEMTEQDYDALLKVLVKVGIVQRGVYDLQWKQHGMTMVRLPGIKKMFPGQYARIKPGSYTRD